MIFKLATIFGLLSVQQAVRAQVGPTTGVTPELLVPSILVGERQEPVVVEGNLGRGSTPMSACNWDNDNDAGEVFSALRNGRPTNFLAVDDFVTTQPELIFGMQMTAVFSNDFSTEFVPGPTLTTSIYSDDGTGTQPMDNGLLQQDITMDFSLTTSASCLGLDLMLWT